jgi:hypothetical protein
MSRIGANDLLVRRALGGIFPAMAFTPAELRRHSEWLLEHARELRREAEAARHRSTSRRIEADVARVRAGQMRQAISSYLAKHLKREF